MPYQRAAGFAAMNAGVWPTKERAHLWITFFQRAVPCVWHKSRKDACPHCNFGHDATIAESTPAFKLAMLATIVEPHRITDLLAAIVVLLAAAATLC
jgi:hypothetical protein